MNNDEALHFLADNQPLPPDALLGERIQMFDEIRTFFKENYDPRCIPFLLNAFGEGDGFGVYQLVEDTVMRYPVDLVLPELQRALNSPHRGIRYWNAQIAALFPNAELVEHLEPLLKEDFDMRYAAVTALSHIQTTSSLSALRAHLTNELNDEIRELIVAALQA